MKSEKDWMYESRQVLINLTDNRRWRFVARPLVGEVMRFQRIVLGWFDRDASTIARPSASILECPRIFGFEHGQARLDVEHGYSAIDGVHAMYFSGVVGMLAETDRPNTRVVLARNPEKELVYLYQERHLATNAVLHELSLVPDEGEPRVYISTYGQSAQRLGSVFDLARHMRRYNTALQEGLVSGVVMRIDND